MDEISTEITILGGRTNHRGVQAPGIARQPFLRDASECDLLAEYEMIHLGIVAAVKPYRFVRPIQRATVFLACFGGAGKVFTDGEWAICKKGTAVLLQPRTCVAYYAMGAVPWRLVWVCYSRADGQSPVATVSSPGLAQYDPQPIVHAVEGLLAERAGINDPACLRHWLELVHRLVLRYAEPWQRGDRLHQVWEKVAADFSADWSLDRIAHAAHCSAEHLRRLCQKELGRSPMQQLTHLRLRRATELLVTTDLKIELVASEIGYHDPFAFSAMFKKWVGYSPTEYRRRHVKGR